MFLLHCKAIFICVGIIYLVRLQVKKLVNEPQELAKENASTKTHKCTSDDVEANETNLMNGLSQMLPLLRKPLLGKCLLVLTIQFCALLG